MRKMLVISCAAHVLILIWGSQVIASRLVFQNFFESMDAWLKCIRFDFARQAALGEKWSDVVGKMGGDGILCPASPEGDSLFELQLFRAIFEVGLPLIVAFSFSWRIIEYICAKRRKRMSKLRAGNNDKKNLSFTMKKFTTVVVVPLKNEVSYRNETELKSTEYSSISSPSSNASEVRPPQSTSPDSNSVKSTAVFPVDDSTISGPLRGAQEIQQAHPCAPSEAIDVGATPHDSDTIVLEQEASEALKAAQETQQQECSRTKKEVVQRPPLKQGSRSRSLVSRKTGL